MKINISNIKPFVSENEIQSCFSTIEECFISMNKSSCEGNEFLGWRRLPQLMCGTNKEICEIKEVAASLRQKDIDLFVVIGIGGSYLGSRAVIESVKHSFSAMGFRNAPEVVYVGHHLSEDYVAELLDLLNENDYAVAVISKSGTTTEPAIAFRIVKDHMELKYGKESSRERIISITDEKSGALKKMSDEEGYRTFVIPDDVGGRFSVLTPVGLLPIAVMGGDIDALLDGARSIQEMEMEMEMGDFSTMRENPIALYVAARNVLYSKGYFVEIMVNYNPKLYYFMEWWKQLFGESEGKQFKGIFPSTLSFTTDLHSMGQYIQEGRRMLFETVLSVEKSQREAVIPFDKKNLDGLNYLSGKPMQEVNRMAELGTTVAHVDGGVPNIQISIAELNEYYMGQLLYFSEISCALSALFLGVNPFNQPGVEAYKRNLFALLGKPGYEKEQEDIRKRLNIKG